MPYPTSPARYLAPIALLVAVLATFLVVKSAHSVSDQAPAATSGAQVVHHAPKHSHRTYVVRPGDTLSAIATKTGVPLATIESLNRQVDANALHAGQTVKLVP